MKGIPAEFFESYGTFRFINMFPSILSSLQNGSTLVVDEFDASLHPMVLMNIINIFRDDNININKAQLIFNTHNPIFLNSNIFRKDEIKFVEIDDDTNGSIFYSLSDISDIDCSQKPRKRGDYMKNYFMNRYGAIKDIDFSQIIKSLLTAHEQKTSENDNRNENK